VKRAVTALASLGIVTALAAPSMAATTVYGSAQLKYTVNATAAVSIAVNYDATGAIQNAVASTILPSVVGNCSAGVAEAALATLTFGGITPPGAGYTGCYYKNAISVGVQSNDTANVTVVEYIDTLAPGTQICAFKLNTPAAAPTQSGATGNPGPYVAACPTVNGITGTALTGLGAAVAGTGFGGAIVPGLATNTTTTPTATAYTAGGYQLYNALGGFSGAAFKYIGQDIQMNVNGTAASGAATNVITIAVIAS
jgi:hypothetical protein